MPQIDSQIRRKPYSQTAPVGNVSAAAEFAASTGSLAALSTSVPFQFIGGGTSGGPLAPPLGRFCVLVKYP